MKTICLKCNQVGHADHLRVQSCVYSREFSCWTRRGKKQFLFQLPVEIHFYNYPYKLKTTSDTMSVLQQKLSNNFPLMKSTMTSPRRSNSPKNNLRLKKDKKSVEETKRERKSCRGMWQVPENHIKWLVMSVFFSDCGNTHLEEATDAAFEETGGRSHTFYSSIPLHDHWGRFVTLRICFSLAELPLILAVLTP